MREGSIIHDIQSRPVIHDVGGKIPPGDPLWHTFNGSFRNVELDTYRIGESVYEGRPLTTWHATAGAPPQTTLGQHLGLDMDTEDERSTLPVLLANKFISRHAAIVHTTTSHTPEAPAPAPCSCSTPRSCKPRITHWQRRRCCGCLDPLTAPAKARFVFGMGLLAAILSSWTKELPLATMKQIIRQYQATGLRERQRHEAITHTTDQQEVAGALRKIPAWGIDYDDGWPC